MFKALAEFVMRGRVSAILVALIGSWLSLISQAALGLVTLRKGWQEGLFITLWACMPAFVGLWLGQVPTPIALATMAVFIVSYVGSCTLRYSVSWPVTTMVLVASAAGSALVVVLMSDAFVVKVGEFFEELMTPPNGELSEEAAKFIGSWTLAGASGLIAYWIGIASIVGLLLARWWQALLYNPGGFQQEFHQFRLPLTLGLLSALAWLYTSSRGVDYQFWASLFAMPLWISGLGLIHWLVKRFKLGVLALVATYIALPFGLVILMLLALLDAGLDLRTKFKTDQSE